jgi:hypothetical protein
MSSVQELERPLVVAGTSNKYERVSLRNFEVPLLVSELDMIVKGAFISGQDVERGGPWTTQKSQLVGRPNAT